MASGWLLISEEIKGPLEEQGTFSFVSIWFQEANAVALQQLLIVEFCFLLILHVAA